VKLFSPGSSLTTCLWKRTRLSLLQFFVRFIPLLLFSIATILYSQRSTASEPTWPKQLHKFEASDFATEAGYKPPSGIERRDQQYQPGIAKRDLNRDGKPELILSYAHTPGQNKVCYYIFQEIESEYRLIGKIYHCGLIVLEPFDGFEQLEGWASGSEGIYAQALYQKCGDGTYHNMRMNVYKATRFTDDGGPIAASKAFVRTHHPNPCN